MSGTDVEPLIMWHMKYSFLLSSALFQDLVHHWSQGAHLSLVFGMTLDRAQISRSMGKLTFAIVPCKEWRATSFSKVAAGLFRQARAIGPPKHAPAKDSGYDLQSVTEFNPELGSCNTDIIKYRLRESWARVLSFHWHRGWKESTAHRPDPDLFLPNRYIY